MDKYNCKNCSSEWSFFPEDYDYVEEDYPDICPLCSMPIRDMIKDVYREEGLLETIKMVYIRLIK